MYAQQKGFPFWPAKVMRILPSSTGSDKDCQYDVRFFGGYHQRALVEKQCIRPITVNIHSLKVWQKNTILLCFFKVYRPKKFMESSSRNFQKNGKYPNFMSFLDRIF